MNGTEYAAMSRLITTSSVRYGDGSSAKTETGRFILEATVPDAADCSWVLEFRDKCNATELKWRDVQSIYPRSEYSGLVSRAMQTIRGSQLQITSYQGFLNVGKVAESELGGDASPEERRIVKFETATLAIARQTSLANIGTKIAELTGTHGRENDALDKEFSGEALARELLSAFGPKNAFTNIQKLDIRTHAVFSDFLNSKPYDDDPFRNLRMNWSFDQDSAYTLPTINRALRQIASSFEADFRHRGGLVVPLVQELDSKNAIHIQAADFAAGWASHQLRNGRRDDLVATFESVYENGILLM